jgi:hypothetical protein
MRPLFKKNAGKSSTMRLRVKGDRDQEKENDIFLLPLTEFSLMRFFWSESYKSTAILC